MDRIISQENLLRQDYCLYQQSWLFCVLVFGVLRMMRAVGCSKGQSSMQLLFTKLCRTGWLGQHWTWASKSSCDRLYQTLTYNEGWGVQRGVPCWTTVRHSWLIWDDAVIPSCSIHTGQPVAVSRRAVWLGAKVASLYPFHQKRNPWIPKEDSSELTLANCYMSTQRPSPPPPPSFLPSHFPGMTNKHNRIRKLVGQGKDREVAYQLL